MLGAIVLSIATVYAAAAFTITQTTGGQQEQSTAEKPWPPPGVSRLAEGITAPRLIRETKPKYTADAMRAKIEGYVVMEAIIERTGRVGEVRVKQSLDREFGLDQQAVSAVRQWRFTPAHKDGTAVPVLVEIEMTFTLRK